jgi:hypothetical protein
VFERLEARASLKLRTGPFLFKTLNGGDDPYPASRR